MEKRIKPRALSGYPEWLPEARLVELKWLDQIRAVFESYGYGSIDPRSVEEVEALVSKGEGQDTDKEIYALNRLAGVMSGGSILTQVLGPQRSTRNAQNALIVVMDVAAFRPDGGFEDDADTLADIIKQLPLRDGFDEALLPGGTTFDDTHSVLGAQTTPKQSAEYLYFATTGDNLSGRSTNIDRAFASSLAESDGNGGVGVTSFIGPNPSRVNPLASEQLVSEATWKQRFLKLRAQMQKKERAISQYKRKIVESVMADI